MQGLEPTAHVSLLKARAQPLTTGKDRTVVIDCGLWVAGKLAVNKRKIKRGQPASCKALWRTTQQVQTAMQTQNTTYLPPIRDK